MKLNALYRIFGNKSSKSVELQVPDEAVLLKEYSIEIVEFTDYSIGVIYLSKDDIDVVSSTFNIKLAGGLKSAFKNIYDELQTLQNTEPTQ